jgi:hypothetical protein
VSEYMMKEFNLSREDCEYSLKGIIIHSGTSEAGHYYSILKIGKDWFKFNDKDVTNFDVKELPHEAYGGEQSREQWRWGDELVYSTNAYILVYKKEEHQNSVSSYKEQLNEGFVAEIEMDN